MKDEKTPSEERESLWLLTYAPSLWAAHFLSCYIASAVWCAKFAGREGALGALRAAIAVATAAALAGIWAVGRAGLRRHLHGAPERSHGFDSSEDRHRFLGYATVLLAALSAVAVIYAGLVVVFIEDCR